MHELMAGQLVQSRAGFAPGEISLALVKQWKFTCHADCGVGIPLNAIYCVVIVFVYFISVQSRFLKELQHY